MKPATLSDSELLEALELAAGRIRLAAAGDLRRAGDVLAGLALEAGSRLRDVLELTPTIDVEAAGRRVFASIKRGDPNYGA